MDSVIYFHTACRCDGMVDVADSKSADGDIVWVRVPPPAPKRRESEQDSLLFGGQPSAGDDPLRSNAKGDSHPLSRSPHANLEFGSGLDCSGTPNGRALNCNGLRLFPFIHAGFRVLDRQGFVQSGLTYFIQKRENFTRISHTPKETANCSKNQSILPVKRLTRLFTCCA